MASYRWKTFFEEEDRPEKPRRYGVTEMRGPHHSLFSQNLLQDVFDSMGQFVDGLKFAGGSHSLMPKSYIKEVTDLAHKHNVYVSSGDWAEYLQRGGPSAFKEYIECSTSTSEVAPVIPILYVKHFIGLRALRGRGRVEDIFSVKFFCGK
ncbi:hypothetical protein SASPL_146507 [Salvia splendens]|uniref:Phosphosulfolactate synthase n=1 Tax=Salvia splendens TaxID=180675 RepID=A0A8X8Z5M5_SALSN|nr:hypothetical protein SASPL_146507 [Salvia splendens]